VSWGKGNERQRTSESNWAQPLAWDREAAKAKIRRRVFCASLADVFDAEVPCGWRTDLFDLIRKTQHLDWLLLTKRIHEAVENIAFNNLSSEWALAWPDDTPVWLGFSAEDQERYNDRIEALHDNPAPIGFLSCEPLLGPIDLRLDHQDNSKAVDWVIVGGESGPNARSMNPEWARSIRDQCDSAGIPFFMKQMSCATKQQRQRIPEDLFIRQFPIHAVRLAS
jgi:protein gp37